MVDFRDYEKLYEVRKTVRFELKPTDIHRPHKKTSRQEVDKLLCDIVDQHATFVNLLGETFFVSQENTDGDDGGKGISHKPFAQIDAQEKEKLESLSAGSSPQKVVKDFSGYAPQYVIRFKYQGITKVFRDEWLEYKEKIKYQESGKKKNKNRMSFADLGEENFLLPFFEQILASHREINEQLDLLIRKEEYDKSRLSDISLCLRDLNSRKYLGALYILFEGRYIVHKHDDEIIEKLRKKLKQLKNNIKIALEVLQPLQSYGLPVEDISLNYYTRNKTPKEYDKKITEQKKLLDEPFSGNLGNLFGIDKSQPIQDLYTDMKRFKAQQKMAFLQLLQQQVSYANFGRPFEFVDHDRQKHKNFVVTLFADLKKEDYETMKELTKQIEMTTSQKERTQLKKKRGNYFMYNCKNYKDFCKNYKDFCKNYKAVATEYGQRKAKVLSLQRAQIEAQKERGRGLLSSNNQGDYFITTFPVAQTRSAYNAINRLEDQTDGEFTVYLLSSLTLRSLRKLCFKKGSQFMTNLMPKIDKKYVIKEHYGYRLNFDLLHEGGDRELIVFYNHVLDLQTTLGVTYRSEDSKQVLREAQTLAEFEIGLKQETYALQKKSVDKVTFEEILEKFTGNRYKITGRDLRKKRDNPKKPTQWWQQFWSIENKSQQYPLRINPEMSISFVEKDEQFIAQNPQKKHNRRYRDRYILTMSMSHKADKQYIDEGFIDDEQRQEGIDEFNKLYNQEKSFEYLYGLDKGTNELVTLGIYKRSDRGVMKVNISEKVPVYEITADGFEATKEVVNKRGERKLRYLKDNPSLFVDQIDDATIFEKKDIFSCLGDLTCAKVIKGNIILNGDQATVRNLYLTDAKRVLYEKKLQGEMLHETIGFDDETESIYYEHEKSGEVKRYTFDNLKKVYHLISNEVLRQELADYLDGVYESDVSIQRINNLRNAVCANMVGVIMKLQEYFPGYVVREGLPSGDTQHKQRIKNTYTYLGNLINEKVYNKLQLTIDVPPILKKFRSEVNVKKDECVQHGRVLYVHEKTSSICPVCGDNKNKLYGHLKGKLREQNMHHCDDPNLCPGIESHVSRDNKADCDYHMRVNPGEFAFISSGDDLATYNIAKKGLDYLQSL